MIIQCLGDGVYTVVPTPWVTTQNPFDPHIRAFETAVFFYCLGGVVGACGVVPAIMSVWEGFVHQSVVEGQGFLIDFDECDEYVLHWVDYTRVGRSPVSYPGVGPTL